MDEVISQRCVGERVSDSIIQFYKPKTPIRLEVVFVHGLEHGKIHGDAYWKTWLTRDGIPDSVWPMTWIPDDFPFAQVFALSYDSSIKQTAIYGRMDLYSLGEKLLQEMVDFGGIGQNSVPVVFVCHGFGGLVAKQIVVTGKDRFSEHYKVQNVLQNIDAFFFYSTPHHGSHLAESPAYRKDVEGGAKGPLLENFEVLNTEGSRLHSDFERSKESSWHFYNVGETHEVSQYHQMIVPEASSRYGNSSYLALSDNHFDICKPKTKKDSGFLNLTRCLREVLKRTEVHLPAAVESLELESLVGLEEQEQRVKSMLQEVPIVGLIGMGGCGKTTLARFVYKSIYKDYERSCYLDDVKSKSTLDEVLMMLRQEFGIKKRKTGGDAMQSNFEDSKQSYLKELKVFVKKHKVLVVVDDVGTANNFERLLKDMDFLNGNNDSKMIVTCRDWKYLKKQVPKVRKYEMVLLNASGQDHELFSYHVFKRSARTKDHGREVLRDLVSRNSSENLMVDFESVLDATVKACAGLPLSLEVMGSCFGGYLHDGDISSVECLEYWRGALHKLKNAEPVEGEAENDRLWKTLQLSYDALHKNEREMFFDIACFFCGSLRYDEGTLLRIWGGQPEKRNELLNLKERCLVKVNKEDGIVTMHDQLRDMGRSVVKGQGRGALKQQTRLWEYEDVRKLFESKEQSSTQGLSLEEWEKAMLETITEEKSSKALKRILFRIFKWDKIVVNCLELRLLNLHNVKHNTIEAIDVKDSSCVQWLSVQGSDIVKVPKFVWSCAQLCVLNLRDCKFLKRLQESIGNLVNLLELDLKNYTSLRSLPEFIGNLVKLSELRVSFCKGLTSLPESIGNLVMLLELNLRSCYRLTRLPESIGNLVNLSKVDVSYCYRLTSLPKSIGKLVMLSKLNLDGCGGLTRLPESVGNLVKLPKLRVSYCKGLTSLPESIGNLVMLSKLNLYDCDGLTSLPESIGNLVKLSKLNLSECKGLTSLPESIGNLVMLSELNLRSCYGLTRLPESIGNLVNLSELDVFCCVGLTRLPESIGNLVNLSELDVFYCVGLTRLPESIGNLVKLSKLRVSSCKGLTSLPESIGNLVMLSELNLGCCNGLTRLPESIGNLVNLLELDVSFCKGLTSLPDSIGNLVMLSELNLRSCYGLTRLPESIGNLVKLSKLDLSYCQGLTSLPESIGKLVMLSELNLHGCEGLTRPPESIGNLVKLSELDLRSCYGLTSLPESIGKLVMLSKLYLCGCEGLTRLPESIGNLVKLSYLDLSGCKGLTSLPESIGNLVMLLKLDLSYCEWLTSLLQSLQLGDVIKA